MLYVAGNYAIATVSMALRKTINYRCSKSKLLIFRGVIRGKSTRSATLMSRISCRCRNMQKSGSRSKERSHGA